jgi:hypothetical protein
MPRQKPGDFTKNRTIIQLCTEGTFPAHEGIAFGML